MALIFLMNSTSPMKTFVNKNAVIVAFGSIVIAAGAVSTQWFSMGPFYYSSAANVAATTTVSTSSPVITKVAHVSLPEDVKGVYMSQCAASSNAFRKDFLNMFDTTELNTVVIDLKDYSGTVAFPSKTALKGNGCTVSDFREFIEQLHKHGVYVIGRMTVFQDPLYTSHYPEWAVKRKSATTTVWTDGKGLSFVDVGAYTFWNYIVELSKEAAILGVDEINYDYIRYPSDGDMADIYYAHTRGTHAEQLERFYISLNTEMRKPLSDGYVPKLSVDLFGMTATNEDDLNIGQQLERAMPYFDFISPMVYPSHYPSGFRGYTNVNEHSYDIVNYSMNVAVARALSTTTAVAGFSQTPIASTTPQLYEKDSYPANIMRPWLQSFDYPVTYSPLMIQEQIDAAHDAGLSSWLFWDAGNRYYALKQALRSATTTISE